MKKYALLAALSLGVSATAHGAVVFQQDFNGSNVFADYISATPNSGQFDGMYKTVAGNDISLVDVSGGAGTDYALKFSRVGSGGRVALVRATDVAPATPPGTLRIEFDFERLSGNGLVRVVFGQNMPLTDPGNDNAPVGRFASVQIQSDSVLDENGNRRFRVASDGGSAFSDYFVGRQRVTILANDTAQAQDYTGLDGLAYSLPANAYTIWIGTTKAIADLTASNGANPLTDFMIYAYNSPTEFLIDNVLVDTELSAVPEPASLTLLSAAGLLLGRRRRQA